MILGEYALLDAIERREILIEPLTVEHIGPNSIDLTLGPELLTYGKRPYEGPTWHDPLDPRAGRDPVYPTQRIKIDPEHGFVLNPGRLYLGQTVEKTTSPNHVPYVDGKSSIGRLGLFVHVTAGRGDVGWSGCWTLELVAVHPVRVYAGMKIAQVTFHEVKGAGRYDGRYQGSVGVVASRPEKVQA